MSKLSTFFKNLFSTPTPPTLSSEPTMIPVLDMNGEPEDPVIQQMLNRCFNEAQTDNTPFGIIGNVDETGHLTIEKISFTDRK